MDGAGTPIEAGGTTSVMPEANAAPTPAGSVVEAGAKVAEETVGSAPTIDTAPANPAVTGESDVDADEPPLSEAEVAAKLAQVRQALGYDDKLDSDREKPQEPDQDLITEFAEARKNSRDEKVDKADFYNPDPKYLEIPVVYNDLRAEFVKEGKDLKDKSVQRELLDKYYYRQAQALLIEGEGKISGRIRASIEFMKARDKAKELLEKSGVQTTDREIDKWALAMYLEEVDKAKKKKKGSVLMMLIKGAVAATVGSGKVVVDDSKPDLNLKGN
jgi:hypothetical protein